jgi:hypothetical protein
MSGDLAEEIYDEIEKQLHAIGKEWQLLDTDRLGKMPHLALMICNWAGFIEFRIRVEAWTDSSRAKAECTVSGLWKHADGESIKSVLPSEIQKAIPAWAKKRVSIHVEPIIEARLMLEGHEAKQNLHKPGGRFNVMASVMLDHKKGRVVTRVHSVEHTAPGGNPPHDVEQLGGILKEGLAEIASAINRQTDSEITKQVVTTSEAAAAAGISTETLLRHVANERIPPPDFPGEPGQAHRWYWENLRPDLEKVARRPLPERFPAGKIL